MAGAEVAATAAGLWFDCSCGSHSLLWQQLLWCQQGVSGACLRLSRCVFTWSALWGGSVGREAGMFGQLLQPEWQRTWELAALASWLPLTFGSVALWIPTWSLHMAF